MGVKNSIMGASKLLDMKLKDVLEQYYVVYSEECCHVYGITTLDAITNINKKYNIDFEPSFSVEPLIPFEYIAELEEDEEILTEEKMEKIIEDNLFIEKRTK